MKAAILKTKGVFDIANISESFPRIGEVLVRVHYTGICGSDVPRVLEGRVHDYPIVLGHEFSGEVVKVGQGVDPGLIGHRVAGIPLIPCGECDDCKKGFYSLCSDYGFIGSRQNGSMAEAVCVPAANVFVVGGGVTDLQAVFFEPATVAIHAMEVSGFTPGSRVLVMGAGTIGLLLAQALRAQGASSVVVCNRSKSRLNCVRQIEGLSGVCTLDEGWRESALHILGGAPNFVFDTVACSDTISACADVAASRATVCFVGTPKNDVSLSIEAWEQLNRKELSYVGSWMSYSAPWPGAEWGKVSNLFASGSLRILDDMIDAIYLLDEVQQAFKRFDDPGSVGGKILIDSWKA